jgi:aryl sulfotransferase
MAPGENAEMQVNSRAEAIAWPAKTRELHNHHINSELWSQVQIRDGDIVIATYAKSGTTWMQQIVAQLVFDGADLSLTDLSPWVDMRLMGPDVFEALERQTHRRFMKTHLPADALAISPRALYIHIGRDGRDVAWSFFNHYVNYSEKRIEEMNSFPGLVGPPFPPCPPDPLTFFRTWFANDGAPLWPFWSHVRSWWAIRHLPNVMFIHFNDLKADLAGSIRRIANFLGISVGDETFPRIVEHCGFDYMKDKAELVAPRGGASFKGGARTFIHKGTNGRWRDMLPPAESAAYEMRAMAELGEDCARWLMNGGRVA